MTARRMTKTEQRRRAHRANEASWDQSTSDGMRSYYRGRRADAFVRHLRILNLRLVTRLMKRGARVPHGVGNFPYDI